MKNAIFVSCPLCHVTIEMVQTDTDMNMRFSDHPCIDIKELTETLRNLIKRMKELPANMRESMDAYSIKFKIEDTLDKLDEIQGV